MAVKKMTGSSKPAKMKPSSPSTSSAAAKNKVALIAKARKNKNATAPAKSRTSVTKSRGSNTQSQVGDMNQREWYNGIRQKAGGKIVNTSTDMNGQLLKVAKKDKDGRVRASSQRAGGKGK